MKVELKEAIIVSNKKERQVKRLKKKNLGKAAYEKGGKQLKKEKTTTTTAKTKSQQMKKNHQPEKISRNGQKIKIGRPPYSKRCKIY